MRAAIIAAAIYGLGFMATFGHSASHAPICKTEFCDQAEMSTARGLMAGMFWPLYWSWEAWS